MRWLDELREIINNPLDSFDAGARGADAGGARAWRRRLRWAWNWMREAVFASRRADLATLASALTYKTLFSLVPVLAVTLAILSSVDNGRYTAMVVDYLRRELPFDHEALSGVIELVEKLARNAWAVAGGGAVLFLWTVISLFTTVENAFGRVWQISRGRSWRRRLPAYITTVVLVPPFLVLSIWVTSRLGAWSAAGGEWLGRLVIGFSAWGLMVIGMTAFYYLMPATRVKLASAVLGGVVAGSFLETAKWGFRTYVGWSATSYQNMYGPLLALPLMLLWLWLVWAIVLGGAELAFVAQHFRRLLSQRDMARQGGVWRVYAAAWALRAAAEVWRDGDDPSRLDERLAERSGLSPHEARDALERLTDAGTLRRLADVEEGYVPRTESSRLTLADAVRAVRDTPLTVPEGASGEFDDWLRGRFAAAEAAEASVLEAVSLAEALDGMAAENESTGDARPQKT